MIVDLDRSGLPEAMHCPVFLSDHCHEPIHGKKLPTTGIVIWRSRADGTQEMATVHKGPCDAAYEAARPGDRWMWHELDVFLGQLVNNTASPFPDEDNVEYVAPPPSTWRQGHYRRSAST